MAIDYTQRIPNNVDLHSDRRLQRAPRELAAALPRLVEGHGAGRHATSTSICAPRFRRGQRLGQFRLCEDAGLSLGHLPRGPGSQPRDRLRRQQGQARLAGSAGRAALDPAPPDRDPGRHRAASVEQQRLLGKTAPSLYDLRNVFQINCEEGRHLWAMVYLLHAYFGRDGREEAEMLLERHSGDPDKPRILGAFNEKTPDWLPSSCSPTSPTATASTSSPRCRIGLRSAGALLPLHADRGGAPHVRGRIGVQRIVQRTCELMKEHKTDDVRALGAIDLATMQKYLNFHFSVSLDLFGQEASTNAANYYTMGVKGVTWRRASRTITSSPTPRSTWTAVEDGRIVRKTVPRCRR
jgi:hypothetical protein